MIEIGNLRSEIERLTDAKRRALAIADERSKENVGQLPDWNGLTNEERTELVRVVSWFNWPPGNDGQFAIEFYAAINKMLRERELREDRATLAIT